MALYLSKNNWRISGRSFVLKNRRDKLFAENKEVDFLVEVWLVFCFGENLGMHLQEHSVPKKHCIEGANRKFLDTS